MRIGFHNRELNQLYIVDCCLQVLLYVSAPCVIVHCASVGIDVSSHSLATQPPRPDVDISGRALYTADAAHVAGTRVASATKCRCGVVLT